MTRFFVLGAAVAIAAAIFAGPAAAGLPPGTVNVSGCNAFGRFVPAGSMVTWRVPWIARTVGLDNLFENTLDLNVSVDGAPVANPGSYWGAPYQVETVFTPPTGYEVDWLYPTGVTLAAGESMTIVWSGVLPHPITDGFQPNDGGGLVSGDVLGGHDTCTVTAF